MKHHAVLILAVALWAVGGPHAARAAGPKPPRISWIFTTTHTNADGTPHTRVSLSIGARHVLIAPDIEDQFSLVSRQGYKERQIPAAAAAACTGWWAGAGDDLYVIRRHGHWEVFRRELDEQAPIPAYHRVKSISTVSSDAPRSSSRMPNSVAVGRGCKSHLPHLISE